MAHHNRPDALREVMMTQPSLLDPAHPGWRNSMTSHESANMISGYPLLPGRGD